MTAHRPSCSTLPLAAALAGILAAGVLAPVASAQEGARPLAVVGGVAMDEDAIRDDVARRVKGATRQLVNAEAVERYVRGLAESEAVAIAARAAGYEKDPEVVAAVRQIIARKYEADQVAARLAAATVGDLEVEAYYRDHPAEFAMPRMRKAAIITVTTLPTDPPEKRQAAREKAERARAQAPGIPASVPGFGELAASFSDDQATRHRGGETGWIRENDPMVLWDKAVTSALFSLRAPGEFSEVIETPAGFHLLRLMEDRPAGTWPFADVKEMIRGRLLIERRESARKAFLEEVSRSYPVAIDEGKLRSLAAEMVRTLPDTPAAGPSSLPLPPMPPGGGMLLR